MVLLLLIVVLIGIATAIDLFYYMFSIPEPEGMSLAHWPQNFTDSFTAWMTYENGELSIEEIGLKRLDEYGLWIQFIDEFGQEIFSHNKPANYPTKYSASEQSRLFERYYRGTNTKEKPEGSGLGLAIANQIVTLHGG